MRIDKCIKHDIINGKIVPVASEGREAIKEYDAEELVSYEDDDQNTPAQNFLRKKGYLAEFKPENQGKKVRLKDGSVGVVQAVGIFTDNVQLTDGRTIEEGDYEILGGQD